MKKSLLALAVLGAFAGVASAQSSVSLYGTVDLNGKYVKNDGSSRRLSMSQDGINSSQLGFKGTEDLGGGLKAGFVLLSGVNADTGTTNNKFFNRRSTVSLWGNFGEVRLGRDYTPTFWNNTIFDAFGTNGLGDSSHVAQLLAATFVRADNSIGYFLPSNLGGIYGQFMAAAGEGGNALSATTGQQLSASSTGETCRTPVFPATTPATFTGCSTAVNSNPGRYLGGRVGFAAGPFDVAVAYGQQRIAATAGTPQHKSFNVGGSYDLGVVKLMGYFDRDQLDAGGVDAKDNRFSISAVVPVGQGEIHVGAERSRVTASSSVTVKNTVSQYALGYVYNLSKRTAVYTNVAVLNNGDLSGLSIAGGSSITAAPTLGGKSKGAEFGLRHFF